MDLFALLLSAALAQEICDRPIPPEDLAPPSAKVDPEFRAFLNAEYQDYLAAAEAYINCLGREHQSIFKEMRAVLERWHRYFGAEARMTVKDKPE
jgi:hypothetical protein